MAIAPSRLVLTAELARALGLPKHARKAVLTLEAGQLPTLDIECLASRVGMGDAGPISPDAVRAVPFMLRLRMEPFDQ